MDFYNALEQYNIKARTKIKFIYIARELGISRQALSQLCFHGGKKGLNKYKDKLKEILPTSLYENIDFPERVRVKSNYHNKQDKDIYFTNKERQKLYRMPYVVTKRLYEKIMNKEPITKHMYEKIKGNMESEEKRLKELEGIRKESAKYYGLPM